MQEEVQTLLSGTSISFDAIIGTGEWGKNLATSAPLFVIPIVGIAATITKLYTAKKFEDRLWSYLNDQIEYLQDTYIKGQSTHTIEYSCDYVEGYAGWGKSVPDVKMLLECK